MDLQLGYQPSYNSSASHKTPFRHEAAPIEPPPCWLSSPAPNMGPSLSSSATLSRSMSNVDSFCYSHTNIIPIDIYIPPATPASLSPSPSSSLSQDQGIYQSVATSSTTSATPNIFSSANMDVIPDQYNAPEFDSTYNIPPISCDSISNQEFEDVMAAMADPFHPSSIAAAKSNYYYWPEDDPTWFEECAYCKAAGPQYSRRG